MAGTLNILVGASLAAAQLGSGSFGGGTTQGAAAPSVTQTWTEREFLLDMFGQPVFGEDHAVDIVRWRDPMGPGESDDEWYIYVTGYQTTEFGATVFATHKYRATLEGPTQLLASVTFPQDPATAIGTNKSVAMAVDPTNGDIYVTGESLDQNNPVTGQDYVTIKYNKDLTAQWNTVSRYNRLGVDGDDIPADIYLMGDTLLVTGRSAGIGTGDDIMTVLLNKVDGSRSILWPAAGADPAGVRTYNGSASGDDTAVGVTGVESAEEGVNIIDVLAWVGGTSLRDRNNFPDPDTEDTGIVTLAYANNGSLVAEQLYDRPIPVGRANDVATDMAGESLVENGFFNFVASRFVVCGYTSSAIPGADPNDTDYIVLNYQQFDGINLLIPAWSEGGARFVTGAAASVFSDDRALAIDTSENIPPFPITTKAWVTGRVREANNSTYDIVTVMYDMLDFYTPLVGVAFWTTGRHNLDSVGMAVEAFDDEAYVTGWEIRPGILDYVTHKFSLSTPTGPVWSITFDAQAMVDFAQAIVAFPDDVGDFPVFVTGGSTEAATGRDQFTIRYDQP